jgi:hypothetical protein
LTNRLPYFILGAVEKFSTKGKEGTMELIKKLGTPTGEVLPCDNCCKTAPLVFADWTREMCAECWSKRTAKVRRAENRRLRQLAATLARMDNPYRK